MMLRRTPSELAGTICNEITVLALNSHTLAPVGNNNGQSICRQSTYVYTRMRTRGENGGNLTGVLWFAPQSWHSQFDSVVEVPPRGVKHNILLF